MRMNIYSIHFLISMKPTPPPKSDIHTPERHAPCCNHFVELLYKILFRTLWLRLLSNFGGGFGGDICLHRDRLNITARVRVERISQAGRWIQPGDKPAAV